MRLINIVVLMLLALPAVGNQIYLERFEKPDEPYKCILGEEFPGAKADIHWDADGYASKGAIKINYDFTSGGRYSQWSVSPCLLGNETAVSFFAKGSGEAGLLVRLIDSTGQIHQVSLPGPGANWQKETISIPPLQSNSHWGGANDGVMHQPVTEIHIGAESSGRGKGTLFIDDLAVESPATRSDIEKAQIERFQKSAKLILEPSQAGFVFYPADKKQISMSIRSVPSEIDEINVQLQCSDAYGNAVSPCDKSCVLKRTSGFRSQINISPDLGYYDAKYSMNVVFDGQKQSLGSGRFSFVVIPAQTGKTKDTSSPFGVNTHFNQGWAPELGKIVKKAGIGWIRDGEADINDRALPVAKANGLNYMPCFTTIVRPVVDKLREGLAAGKTINDKWDFTPESEKVAEYVRKYSSDIDVYDIYNEPYGPWGSVLGGGWWGGDWLKVFVQWGRQMTSAIHKSDPGSAVLWEDVDQLLYYTQLFDLKAKDTIDVISPHPYNMHRSNPYPEDHPIIKQLSEFHNLSKEHKLRWKVISGEVGFSSFTMPDTNQPQYYADCTELQQAQLLVRMMVGQFARGVERIFWYDFMNDGNDSYNPEHNFGLIHNDMTPKPALVAYANLISHLKGCRWLGSYSIGGGGYAYVYVNGHAGKPTLIAWLKTGSKPEAIPVTSGINQLTVTDIFGKSTALPVKNKCAVLPLSDTPVYVTGLNLSDVSPLIQPLP